MEKTVKDHLVDIFDDLENEKLKRFKDKLRDRREEPRVSRAAVDKTELSFELADLMINTFTSKKAPAVTIQVLEAIACNQQAEDLKKALGQCTSGAQNVVQPVAQLFTKPVEVDLKASQSVQKTDDSLSDDCPVSLELTTCNQQFKDKIPDGKDEEVYKPLDKSVRKRLALLITNIDFDNPSMNRRGAEKDEENMEWLLQQLDYAVVKYKNLSGKEMDDVIKSFAQRKEHADSDSTFVVIMSHGKRDTILGVHYDKKNNDILLVDKIYTHLNSSNCPALLNKPKVILIQACRGDEHGHVWVSDGELEQPKEIEGDDFEHKEKDFISLMSSTPDTKSYRHIKYGSFYVRCVVDVFGKCAHEDHIEELFRKVMRRFESDKRMIGGYKQMVCKDRATLTKHFYLFPGL
ncbi:caspase a-like [Paramisgurnus dabryanus]|uniref:caspase a-like n=1 Tax=Paramisgurnus dabryanus TaxID=90735 RepID=UPI003CCF5220